MLDRKGTHWSTRLMAAFLAFVMLLGNVPAGVFATEITGEEVQDTTVPETSAPVANETEPTVNVTEPDNETAEELTVGTVDVYVNPLYADVITEEMVRNNGQQIPAVMTFSEPEYVSYANALELLREQLALRAESTTLYIRSETSLSSSYYVDLFHSAMEHTGNPRQGDYLHCNMGGCEFLNLTEQIEDGVYYYTATFCPVWFTTAEMEAEMDAAVDSLLTQLNLWDKTDYQKIRGVYDYICGNIKYDYDTLDDDSYKLKYTAYAALVNKTAVCQGFASLFYRLMLELGVDCRYISGWAGDENHGWNIVRLDDVYYNVDATWDAGLTVYYRYFLCTPENFPDHARSSEFTTAAFMSRYPMATMPYVVNVQASGTLNNGMKWVLDGDTGILTVSGTGAMPNWGSLDAPWYPYAESIRGAVLTEGITSVGDSAFLRCKNMTSVQLPSTLTRIGEYGFDNCRSLKQIELPEGLKTIDAHAFSECTALREIVIPSTVTTFGSSVFSNCYYLTKVTFAEGMKSIPNSMFFNSDSLKSVVFPSTLTEIGSTAFRMCDSLTEVTLPAGLVTLGTAAFADCTKLKNIYVEDGNTSFMSKNGVLFSKDGKTLWCFPAARTGTYTIPDGTVTIENAAFGSARISNVIFPDSVKTIDTYGFARSWLREVVVGEGVEYVGDTAFGLCDYLTKVTFGKALKEIDSAFSYYRGSVLREVVFTGDAPRFDSYTFYTTTVTAYYPSNNPTWTSSVRQNYRGTVTWKGMHVCAYDAVVTAPTCTEQGYTTHTCTCGDRYVDSYTAPLGHSYEAAVTPPTCTEQGYTTHTCECGDSYVDFYVERIGHSYKGLGCAVCGKAIQPIVGDDELCVTVTPENYWTVSNVDTEKLACGPGLVAYGDGNFAVAYLADDTNTVETESSGTIVCRIGLFNIKDPEYGKFLDIATAGQTIGDVTIGSKAPYEPNLIKFDDSTLLILFNIRTTDGKYIYYSATFDTTTNTVVSYQNLTLDGKEWTPGNVAASYNAIAENTIDASGPTGSMVFTSQIIQHEGYYYGYCGGISNGFSGMLVRSVDGIHWTAVLAPETANDMKGVIECGFQFLNDSVYFCMRDISSGVYHCSYNFSTGAQLMKTEKLPGLTTSKPAAFIQDGKMYLIVNQYTGDDNTVGRRNTAQIYRVDPETCGLTLMKQVFCKDGCAYHTVVEYGGINYWCFHTDARRINPYTQGRSNLALLPIPNLVETGSENGELNFNAFASCYTRGCITGSGNVWQGGAVNMHYQIPLAAFADHDAVTITANADNKCYVAFFTQKMTTQTQIAYAEGWAEQLIMEPGTSQTLPIPGDAQYLYILATNAAGNDLLPKSVVFHNHIYVAAVTPPTCTEQGYTTHTCECGDEYVDSYVDALGHNYEGVYCGICGEKNPDLTDCPENPVSTEWPRVNTDLSHIICYGQSFSVGSDAPLYPDPAVDGVYVYGSLTNSSNGKSLIPIPTTGNQHAIISAGNVLARLLAEGGYDTDLVLGSYGSGGRTIAQLMSEDRQQQIKVEEGYTYDCLSSGRYEVFETSVDALAEFADNSGKSISCPVIVYLQGETDQNTDAQLGYPGNPNRAGYGAGGDKEKYKQYMTWLKEDMQSKVMEAYGQTEKPLFVIYQVSGTYVRTQYSSINMAQIEFAQEHEDVILVQTPYFTSHYTGTHHLTQNGYRWLGEYIGRYVHTALTQRVKPWPMLPEKFEILSENTIRIRVSGAENGLSIDTYTVENATNSKNRYGFNILVDGTNVVPKTAEVSGNEIILTLPDNAASLLDAQAVYVQYAGQKAQGTGNIRDNCTELGFYEYLDDSNDTGTDKKQSVSHSSLDKDGNSIIGKKYPLYNWLASFSYRVNTNDLHVHNYVETVIAPTCSTRGYTAYACACGDAYAGEFVDATGIHTYEAVVTEPTCTEGGYTTYICTCGDVREITDHTDPLGHREVVDARILPTAGKAGLTEGSHCAACGEILKAQEVIPATGYEKALEDGAFKVLLVGNTFSEDAANYGYGMTTSQLLDILQGMLGEDVKVTVGLIHYSASSLAWHATQAYQNTSRYAFRVIDSEKRKWETVGTVSSAVALQWADWDAVVLQPFSVEAISGKANPIHADQEDAQFYPLENSTSYMLDHVNRYAPNAEIYCFMHWQRYNLIKLNVGLSQHNTMADFFPVVMDYRGTESGARYDEIIPVGTAVQNARTTYLSLLSYNTDGKVTLKEDPQFGLQRDVNHLSLNVGRYIVALTFAETLIPEEIRTEAYVIPDIRSTESVGKLPKEYTVLAQKAVQAAVNSWKNNSSLAVTEIEGYREDPTVAAAEKLAAVMLEIPCALDVADLQNRIAAAALEELPEDFSVDAVALAEGFALNAEGQNFTATVTIRFGYTSKNVVVGVTVGGHDYEAVVTTPTCSEQGYTTHTCAKCGNSYTDSYVDATGHKFGEWTTTKVPTCTVKGADRRDCENCNHFETREVDATGHDYEVVITKPTCLDEGYTTHTCSKCNDSYIDSYVDAVGHKFGDWEIVEEPSCTDKGAERRDCANCDHFETREVDATGHDYETVVTAPTCTEQGYTTHTCTKCSNSVIDSYVDGTGHSFTPWRTTKDATFTEPGEESRECEKCSHVEFREVQLTVVTTGNFGAGSIPSDQITYTLYSNGTMVVEGNGSICHCDWNGTKQPFIEYRKQIKHLIIGEGITQTAGGCFAHLTNLLTVSFPSSLTKLHNNAFMSSFATSVTEITIPETVSYMGVYSIGHHSGDESAYFTDIILENPNITIADNDAVFNGGAKLNQLTLYSHGTQNNVSAYAAKYGIKYIDLDSYVHGVAGEIEYRLYNGVLTLRAESGNAIVPAGDYPWNDHRKEIQKIVIDDGVIGISENAFVNYAVLEEVELPDNFQSLGSGAFVVTDGNSVPMSIVIPKQMKSLGENIFAGRSAVNATAYYGSIGAELNEPGVELNLKKVFKLLLIGNSYSEDASCCAQGMKDSMLFDAIQAMLGEDAEVVVGAIISGGKGINWHATQAENGNKSYYFKTMSSKDKTWKSQGSTTSADALAWTDWDAVSLQHYGINTKTGMESIPYPDSTDEKFYPLETASEYMLDHINKYAPQADVYFYMHWAQTSTIALNAAKSTYIERANFMPVVLEYAGTESGKQFKDIIPVGLSVQNARTTYLALLAYNTTAYADKNLNLNTDAQIGLQRDGGHLSFNIGRYIAGLTFAETIIPMEMRAEGYVLPDIRITESVGRLPKEYTVIAQKSVFAAVESWRNGKLAEITEIEGYREDPTVAAAEKLSTVMLEIPCALDVADLQNRIAAATLEELPEDFSVDAVALAEGFALNAEGQNVTATVTIRFGYTSKNVVVGVTVGGHDYEAVVTAPTCVDKGYTTHTCANCGDSYVDGYVDATGHKFGDWTTTKVPTCTEKGMERRECDNCNHVETHEVEATGHDYEAVVTAPTCTEQGFTTHTCPKCNDSYVDSYINATGHEFGDWRVTTEATCTEKGEERRACANCDHFEIREVAAIGHDYEAVVTAPTCVDKGYTTHTCANCDDSYVDSYVNALGHEYGEWYVTKQATLESEGEERRDCDWCDDFQTRKIPKLVHNYVSAVTEPTCTEQGYTTHTCQNCGDEYVDTYVNALGHNFVDYVSNDDASCTVDGTKTAKCERCDETDTIRDVGTAKGHKFGDWTTTKVPTCTEKGKERRDCDNCDHFETREIAAAGHDYDAVVTAPTCTEKGFTSYTCSKCKDSYVDSYVDAIGHKYGDWEIVDEPTCTEKGEERRDCENCDHFETREVAAAGHDYETVVTAPTCVGKGYTTHICHCGDSYIDSYVDATGHKFGEWSVTTEPTCTERGEERRECENCDHAETRDIAAAGHDYEGVVTKPTCTDKGYTTHTCHCGDSYIDSYVEATGHKFGDWTVTTEPSCIEKGIEKRECENCDHFEAHEVDATGHDYVAEVTAPTCTEKGYTTHTCSKCKDSYVDSYIDATGHKHENGSCSICGEPEVKYLPGDVDLDGDVDVDDVLALLWYVLFPDDYPIEVDADFDRNDNTDVDDVLTLLWYVLFPEDYPLN